MSARGGGPAPGDQDRMIELRTAWGMLSQAPLVVIGRLRSAGEKAFLFLEALEHPTGGNGLTYPTQNVPASAYIPAEEAKRVVQHLRRRGETIWAIAELVLSPERERLKHANPHACMVRLGTLRLLEELPPEWNATVIGGEAVQLLTTSARTALEDHVRAQVMAATAELTAGIRDQEAKLEDIGAAVVDAQKRQIQQRATIEAELAQGRSALADLDAEAKEKRELLDNLSDTLLWKTQNMEARFRRLSDLLAQKGDRLRALGLVDATDLEAMLPTEIISPEDEGQDFELFLGEEFSRIAPFVQARLWRKGMLFSQAQLRDFLALIRTHDLIVLAGDSGSGKTSLVRSVAEAIGARGVSEFLCARLGQSHPPLGERL